MTEEDRRAKIEAQYQWGISQINAGYNEGMRKINRDYWVCMIGTLLGLWLFAVCAILFLSWLLG